MEFLSIYSILVSFMKKNTLIFVIYFLITILLYPFHYIIIPKYYGMVINSFKDKSKAFVYFVKMLLGAYVLCWILEMCLYKTQSVIFPEFAEYTTGSIFEFIIDHYELDFENIHTGEILSKIIRMPGVLADCLQTFGVEFIRELFVSITAVYTYYSVSTLTMSVYIGYAVLYYVFVYFLFKYLLGYDIEKNKAQDKMYECLVDCFNNFSSIYAFNQQPQEKQRFYDFIFKDYKERVIMSWSKYLNAASLWGGVTVSLFVSLNYLIYYEYTQKKIDAETLISTFIVTFSIIRLYEKAVLNADRYSDIYGKVLDTENFFNEISRYNMNAHKKNINAFKNGDIAFKGVYHKYKNQFVLENIDIHIEKGEKVAFVGQIGSGKTTLIKLLLGFQILNMGKITIGELDVNHISNTQLRENIFYIPQKPKLFNRTLYENITYGIEKKPSKESILLLLDDLKLNDIRSVFEHKMDDTVGVEGNELSGGQRQIVWLLRAFYRQAPVLVLDEPTAALDPATKVLVMDVIKRINIGKTVIIVSHDPIDSSFRQIKLKKGRVIQETFFN
uniref:ABC transporter domain-containing protein n=1 Tax=viral metagenome TaxID=1070528 RepID=A0A6C0HPR1_9ZZZZ